jgi:hypothetical protein
MKTPDLSEVPMSLGKPMFIDRKGQPLSRGSFFKLLEDLAYRRVAWTDLANGRAVSTVWTGMNLSPWCAVPMIFETMVFEDGLSLDDELGQIRSATEAEALAAHEKMVKDFGP